MGSEELKNIAIRAAYSAGEILKYHYGKLTQINKKGSIDLVTAADISSEKAIITTIKNAFPDHLIIAEESGQQGDSASRHKWIIDPLDGTTNFVHSLPIFSVSIAHSYDGKIDLGVVFNPISEEFFYAQIGQGAVLNDVPISVSNVKNMVNALLVTGFPYSVREASEALMQRFEQCLQAAQGIRRLGSAALDLCYVACGRFDGFWEENLNPWDTAAGMLIAREAGGRITDFKNRTYGIDFPEIVATNRNIHTELIDLLNRKNK